jgi:hypothetical protein
MTQLTDILAILESLGVEPNPEAKTVQELSSAWGRGPTWCRGAIRSLADQGFVRVTHRVVPRIDGQTTTVPAYVISVPIQSVKGTPTDGPRNSRTRRRRSNPAGVR